MSSLSFYTVLILLADSAVEDGQADVADALRVVAAAVENGRAKDLAETCRRFARDHQLGDALRRESPGADE